MRTILFIHGMGGGSDSRVPRLLREYRPDLNLVARTYAFDPEIALVQIQGWIDEVKPDLIMAESMGANYALVLGEGVPRLLISPGLGAPALIGKFCWLSLIPGEPALWGRIFKPREGDRQALSFDFRTSSHFRPLAKMVRDAMQKGQPSDGVLLRALFGRRDFYRKWGVVNIRRWKKHFGQDSCAIDDDSHFWNEERVQAVLLPELERIMPR